jgi:hypothetical protein
MGLRGSAGAAAYDAGGGMDVITGAPRGFAGTGTVSSLLHFGQRTFLPAAALGAASFFPHEHTTAILDAGRAAGAAGTAPGIWRIFLQAGQRAALPTSVWGTLRILPQLHVICMGDPQDVREMQVIYVFYETAPRLSTHLHTIFSMATIS